MGWPGWGGGSRKGGLTGPSEKIKVDQKLFTPLRQRLNRQNRQTSTDFNSTDFNSTDFYSTDFISTDFDRL